MLCGGIPTLLLRALNKIVIKMVCEDYTDHFFCFRGFIVVLPTLKAIFFCLTVIQLI